MMTKPKDELVSKLMEGCLGDDEAVSLVDCMQDPDFTAGLVDNLSKAEFVSRECNPARSDKAFLVALSPLIGGALDGEFDAGDGNSPDAGGPRPDPGTPGGIGGAGGGMSAGVVKGALGTILALAAAAGIYHAATKGPVEPQPPPTVPEPVALDIVAEADTCYSWIYNHRAGGQQHILNVDGNLTGRAKRAHPGAVVRFDLSGIPDHVTRVDLRLFAIALDPDKSSNHLKSLITPDTLLDLYLVDEDSWDEMVPGKDMPLGKGEPLTTFSAAPGAYTDINLTDVVLAENRKDGKLTIRIEVAKQYKKPTVHAFASREFPVRRQEEKRAPCLRVTYLPKE